MRKGAILPVYESHRYRPTLVFLHYWGGSSRTWAPVIARLENHATLAIDFRGWGRSNTLPGPYRLHQLAQDTLDVIAAAGVSDYLCGADVAVVPNTGHLIPLEAPAELAHAINSFAPSVPHTVLPRTQRSLSA